MKTDRWLRRLRAWGAAALAVCLAFSGVSVVPAQAVDETHGYDGYCLPKDSNGVTVVIDFQDLSGNDGREAATIIRCAPAPGNDASVSRTGLQVLVDAGIEISGTDRWGQMPNAAFVCRIEGRPAADEPLYIKTTDRTYFEQCRDTPPGAAYWSYWYADGSGEDWHYSDFGVMARKAIPGGFEGWSFSHNADFAGDNSSNPEPRVTAVNPELKMSLSVSKSAVQAGQPVTLTWDATGSDYVTASGAWNGRRLSKGTETVTPQLSGQLTFTATAVPSGVSRSVTLTVTPAPVIDDGSQADETVSALATSTAQWLVGELSPPGQMPGPSSTTDWGLTIDTLWALYAAGTGKSAAAQIASEVDAAAGEYMGPDLFGDKDARIAGATAKLLVAAVVAGKDPTAFGQSKYLSKGQKYDLRAETAALIGTDGMIRNHNTGSDDTNIFAQSLAVIGLARSGGIPTDKSAAVQFLLRQQCSGGYFRMFYSDGLTCDAGKGTADGDGTAMAVQALIAARSAGVTGLDDAINHALDWIVNAQRSDGSFGGGVSTEASNSNSTGLLAQAMAAGRSGADSARAAKLASGISKARSWVLAIHSSTKTAAGTKLASEYGAIAYNPTAFVTAKTAGISAGMRDQWRRATVQAVFALAPVSFGELGLSRLSSDPSAQRPDTAGVTTTAVKTAAAAPRTASSAVTTIVQPSAASTQTAATSAAALANYLTSVLVDGTHIEITIGSVVYIDYDATADAVFALRTLGAATSVIAKVDAFLLTDKAIAGYAHGEGYEKGPASYAEPLAKLSLIARMAKTDAKPPDRIDKIIASLSGDLAALRGADGRFTDTGTYADTSGSTQRHAWATLASTVASGESRLGAEQQTLLDAQCADGLFAATLDAGDCESGDVEATSLAVAALNVDTATAINQEPAAGAVPEASNAVPAAWSTERIAALQKAASGMAERVDRTGLVRTNRSDLAAAGALAAGRAAVGLDGSSARAAVGARQLASGGLPATATAPSASASDKAKAKADVGVSLKAAPALAGSSWLSLSASPLRTVVQWPVSSASDQTASPSLPATTAQQAPPWWWFAFMALALGMGATAVLASRRRPPIPTQKEQE